MIYGLFTPEGYLIYNIEQGVDFDTYGDERFMAFCKSVNKQPEDLIEITAEQREQLHFTGDDTQLIWDFKNQAVVPRTKSHYEIATNLSLDYERDLKTLKDALLTALLADDQDLIQELKEEYQAVLSEYNAQSLD